MNTYSYSIGLAITDSHTVNATAQSWPEFVKSAFDVPESERSLTKGGRYIAWPFAGTRSKANVIDSNWLAFDYDNLTPVQVTPLLAHFAGAGLGLCYRTNSSTPEAPRLRLVLAADRIITPDERKALSAAVSGIWQRDTCQDNAAQPAYLPTTGSPVTVFGTVPLCVNDWLALCPAPTPSPLPTVQMTADWTDSPLPEWSGCTDDAGLIAKARNTQPRDLQSVFGGAPKYATFAQLWDADTALAQIFTTGTGGQDFDHSAADFALAKELAYWTGKNCARIERLMRESDLMRDKWDHHRNYLYDTILNACAACARVDGDKPAPSASNAPDDSQLVDFLAYLPAHTFIHLPTRQIMQAQAVDKSLRRLKPSLGTTPTQWLCENAPIHQMSWQPGYPEIIEGMKIVGGSVVRDSKCRTYNRYTPTNAVATREEVSLWMNHVKLLYPEDADHLLSWFAFKMQNAGKKINHAIVLGGGQGIGKDLLLSPVRYGAGAGNSAEINPPDFFSDFHPFVESTLLIVNEARDMGDADKFKLYDTMKRYIAAPPDTLTCNLKHQAAYDVPNVMGVVITSNRKLNGLYLDPDDRRHYVAWSSAERQTPAYYEKLVHWLEHGGKQAVYGYLMALDVSAFKPAAPPPKTEAWHAVIAAHGNPDDTVLTDMLTEADGQRVQIITAAGLVTRAAFAQSLPQLSQSPRKIPQMLERVGYTRVSNPDARDGRWRINGGVGRKDTVYALADIPHSDRLTMARTL